MKRMITVVAVVVFALVAFVGASDAAQGGASNSVIFHGSYVKDGLKPIGPIGLEAEDGDSDDYAEESEGDDLAEESDGDDTGDLSQEVVTWSNMSVKHVMIGSNAGSNHCAAILKPRDSLVAVNPGPGATLPPDEKLVMVGAGDPQREILCNALISAAALEMRVMAQVTGVTPAIQGLEFSESGYLTGITVQ